MRPEDVDLLLDRLGCDDPERADALAAEMTDADRSAHGMPSAAATSST